MLCPPLLILRSGSQNRISKDVGSENVPAANDWRRIVPVNEKPRQPAGLAFRVGTPVYSAD